MGKEYKAKGVDVALAPVIGPLGRIATGGRNWVSNCDTSAICGKELIVIIFAGRLLE